MPAPSRLAGFVVLALALTHAANAQQPRKAEVGPPPRVLTPAALTTAGLKGLELRAIGSCITPGRVGDIASDP